MRTEKGDFYPPWPLSASLVGVDRVFILGAGFSRAIHQDMPLLHELGAGVRSTLRSRNISVGSDLDALDNVEHWLSLLAEPAPWLDSSEQMRNSALFVDVSRAIHEVLTAMQIKASIVSPPAWLFPLVKYWHRTQSTVITFNYDCLVELAYMDAVVPEFGSHTAQSSDPLAIPVTPAALRVAAVVGGNGSQTFKLLKLHGSVDWWYSGVRSEPSDPIYRMGWIGDFKRGIIPFYGNWHTLIADKVPMLIPPAATKAPFYQNRLLAAQWVQAGEALRQAAELVLIGYSAPLTDLTVTTLVTTQFSGDVIVPINPDPGVLKRSQQLGSRSAPPTVIDSFIGDDAIARWVATFAA